MNIYGFKLISKVTFQPPSQKHLIYGVFPYALLS